MGISRSELFRRAIREFLAPPDDREVTDALNALYGPGGERARIDPVFRSLQEFVFLRERW